MAEESSFSRQEYDQTLVGYCMYLYLMHSLQVAQVIIRRGIGNVTRYAEVKCVQASILDSVWSANAYTIQDELPSTIQASLWAQKFVRPICKSERA